MRTNRCKTKTPIRHFKSWHGNSKQEGKHDRWTRVNELIILRSLRDTTIYRLKFAENSRFTYLEVKSFHLLVAIYV